MALGTGPRRFLTSYKKGTEKVRESDEKKSSKALFFNSIIVSSESIHFPTNSHIACGT